MSNLNQINLPAPLEPLSLFDRLRAALLEDLGPVGDVTSQALVPEGKQGRGTFLIKADGILCGVKLLPLLFQMTEQVVSQHAAGRAWDLHDAQELAKAGKADWNEVMALSERLEKQGVRVAVSGKDGQAVKKGDVVATVEGDARALLAGERTALNLLSHLSGIATQTAQYASRIAHTKAKILDTRKTMPLWRDLTKYAVKCGGGENHRRALYDMILIKDNHLALWGAHDPAGAVNAARAKFPQLEIEVEVTDLSGLQHVCTNSKPQMILLDNFPLAQLKEAVAWCENFFAQKKEQRPLLEASGGITLETVAAIAEAGVDRISVGALTHSVKALDISLELNF
ncbi:MAG TPA: carboxylating nicotinate-nucleotide diphosphorylase [Planctomycetota bacterium]|nr:carboxylating nicotinate-nucleotide diphosphorylase [Planctomycetota bacterium]